MFYRSFESVSKALRATGFKRVTDAEHIDVVTPSPAVAPAGTSSTSPIQYRADIDGLRAIAVLLVLVFHGGLAWLPSGFIGVDIFFVISGYLTTSIILKAMDKGTFSFSGFYARRIWRLQPAVIALLIVTLALATLLYLPDDYTDFLKSEKYTSLLLSNQYFYKATSGYATPDSASLPLLHTWSLAIEWQWYLVLPLGLWLLRRHVAKGAFKATVLGLTVAAMALALYWSHASADRSYYFFTARIFELMIGACAVIFSTEQFRLTRFGASVVGMASLATIIYCATREDILTGFPNYHAIAVCMATGALLFRGVSDASITSRLLVCKPLVLIGTLSYSLYLWHWPILAFMNYMGIAMTPLLTAVYFVATFVLGWLSYVLVENKFRKARLGFGKTLLLLMLLPVLAFSLLHSASNRHDGWPERFGDRSQVFSRLKAAVPAHREDCLGASDGADPGCVMGATQTTPQVFLMGDSFSNQYWGFVETLARDANLSVLAQAYPACLALPQIYLYDWYRYKKALYEKCHHAASRYYDIIANNHFRYVIVGQYWEAYLTDAIVGRLEDPRSVDLSLQRLNVAIREGLDIIVQSGATPVFLLSTAPKPDGINACLFQEVKLRGLLGSAEYSRRCASVPWAGNENPVLAKLLNDLQAEYPALIIIDPKRVQCANGTCSMAVEGVPVYRDIGHLTDYAAYAFGATYLKRFGNPLKAAN